VVVAYVINLLHDLDTIASYYPSDGVQVVLPICIVALLADGHTFRSNKRVYEKRMPGIGVP
jgi:hypothetical protein